MVKFTKIDLIKMFRLVTGETLVNGKIAVERFLAAHELAVANANLEFEFDSKLMFAFVHFMSMFSQKLWEFHVTDIGEISIFPHKPSDVTNGMIAGLQ